MPSPAALRVSMMRSSQKNAGEAELIDAITAASAFVGDESAGNSLDRAGRGEQREQGEEWDAIVVSGQK